jgi:Lon protease-like protein
MSDAPKECCLFPLGTVLFPEGPLPLRIFEPRYLDMISRCLRNDEPFGVCLIRAGKEVGSAAEPFRIGTLAKIVDWTRYDDGVLGISAVGTSRIRVIDTRTQDDQLLLGTYEVIPESEIATPPEAQDLVGLVERLLPQVHEHYQHAAPRLDDASALGYRLSELIPLPMTRRQHLLELPDPLERLDEIRRILEALEVTRPTQAGSHERNDQ